jgi:hypothetical protein
MKAFELAGPKLETIGHGLLHPTPPSDENIQTAIRKLVPGGEMAISVPEGSAAIRCLEIRLRYQGRSGASHASGERHQAAGRSRWEEP